jgi:hypothetical protein
MTPNKLIPILFFVAAAYDAVLGVVFLLAPGFAFELFDVVPPNHVGYVQFPALLLLIFALIFSRIAMDPVANRSLIPYGMLLKVSYCGVVFWHWFATDIPWMWKPFAILDLVFLALFWMAYARVNRASS